MSYLPMHSRAQEKHSTVPEENAAHQKSIAPAFMWPESHKLRHILVASAVTLGLFLVSSLLMALVSGLLAVMLVQFAYNSFTVSELQGIINVFTLIFTLALVPVFLHLLLVGIKAKTDLSTWVRLCKRSLKTYYFRLGAVTLVSGALGWLVLLLFEHLPQGVPLLIIKYGVLLIIGIAAFVVMYRMYSSLDTFDTPAKGKKKNTARPAGTHAYADSIKALSYAPRVSPYAKTDEPCFVSSGALSIPQKVLNVTLSAVLLAGIMPSMWLYATREAHAVEHAKTEFSPELTTPNVYIPEGSGAIDEGAGEGATEGIPEGTEGTATTGEELLREPVLPEDIPAPEGAVAEVGYDRYTTTWLNADGTYTTRIQNEPLTYVDEKGTEQDIDNTLIEHEGGFTNAANNYSAYLPKEGSGITLEKEDTVLTVTPLFGELKDGAIKENAILYNNVSEGIDIQYSIFGSEVKEDIILNAPTALTSLDFKLEAEGITFASEGTNVYGFKTGEETLEGAQPVFTLSAPVMTDAEGATSIDLALKLATTAEGTILKIVPSAEWLSAPERVWPVIIDPTHTLSDTSILQGTIQAYQGPYSSGPDMEHYISYLYVGLEDGSIIGVPEWPGGPPIIYGQSWSFIQIKDISPYLTGLPEEAILSARLLAYKYKTAQNAPGAGLPVDAKMIMTDWAGDGRRTWNNRPYGADLTWLDTQYTPGGRGWMSFNITEAFKSWKNNPSSNRGIMLAPQDESQAGVSFSGTGNSHGQQALYLELSWTVPNAVDENMPYDASDIKLRPLTYKDNLGIQNLVGLFADGLMRPALKLDYSLIELANDGEQILASDTCPKTEYDPIYPNSDLFLNDLAFTLGYRELYESNWQTELYKGDTFELDTLYQVRAQGTRVYDFWSNPGNIFEQTPLLYSDTFIVYQFKDQDTLPYVAAYYGVAREQIALDNRVGDDLAMPGNTLFIRNPNENATLPYTRPDELTLEHKRALIYANMGRSQVSEFDMEPVNMNTGNFYLEHTDAVSYEYGSEFAVTRSYNALAPQSSGPFGRGWASPYHQLLTTEPSGTITYITEDGRHLVFEKTDAGWASPVGYNLTLERQDNADPHLVTYSITKPDGTRLGFNSYGLLASLTTLKGLTTTIAYDSASHMESITTPSGATYAVKTDASGHITSLALPNGAQTSYGYNAEGYLTSATDADGSRVRYEYNARGQMSAWYDGEGTRVVANVYDEEGRLAEQTDALGNLASVTYADNTTTLTDATGEETIYHYNSLYQTKSVERAGIITYKSYNPEGQLVSSTDGLGRTTTYTYDQAGNLTTTTRADGTYQQIDYDNNANPTTVRDFDGTLVTNSYDSVGNLTSRTNADGTTVFYSYDEFGRVTALTDEAGATTTFTYNGTASLVTTDALGATSTTCYDAMGRVVSEVDALGVEHKTIYSSAGRVTGTWVTDGITTSSTYDGAGRCIAITDEYGVTSSYSYDAAGNLIAAAGPEGSLATSTYDALGNKTSETDSLGNTTTFTYDAHGNLVASLDALGSQKTFAYDAAGRLTEETNSAGAPTTYTYDGAIDQPATVVSPEGMTRFTYDASGRLLSEEYPNGTSRAFTYDARGNVTSETDESSLTVSYTYDSAGRPTQISDSAGRTERSVYDVAGNLTSTTDALGRETSYTYDALGRVLTITAPGALTTTLAYDARGNITRLTQPGGSQETFTYDAAGNLQSATDADGYTTTYHYTERGDIEAVIDARGATTTYSYDQNQRLQTTTGALGETATYTFDELGRPVAISDARSMLSTLTYDAQGQVTNVVAPDGSFVATTYDTAGRVVETKDSLGLITTYTYDEKGRLTRQTDNAGHDTTFTYDASGRVLTETDALGRQASYTYDAWGNLTEATDLNGTTTTYTYDLLGRMVREKTSAGVDNTYTYDEAGNLASLTDVLGRMTHYTYDALGRVTLETDALGQEWHYAYDERGNLIKTTTPEGVVTTATYDGAGRAVSLTDGESNTTTLTYDLSGNLIGRLMPTGALDEYAYDAAGNTLQHKDALGYVTSYEYDEVGNLITETSPRGAKTYYTYDHHGNLTESIDALGSATTHTYSLANRRLTTMLPNGLEQTYAYDEVGRVTSASDATGLSVAFEYDRAGNVASETRQNGARTTFTYDRAGHLLETVDPLGARSTYTYDEAGNLISSSLPAGGSYTYTYDELNRMVSGTHSATLPVIFAYDSAGRVVATEQGDKKECVTYDGVGNAQSVTDALGNTAEYVYNEVGLPVSYTNRAGASTTSAYDLKGQLVSATDETGASRSLTYDADGNITSFTDALGNTTTYAYDFIGNLTSLSDALGRYATYTYDIVGNVTSETVSAAESSPLYGATAQEQALGITRDTSRTTTYDYDLHGNLVKITSPAGSTEEFVYDTESRLVSSSSSGAATINYDYDLLGNLITKSYSTGDTPVTYAYDSAGNRLTMNDSTGESSYTYNEAGQLTSFTQGNGFTLAYAYDEYGRMSSVSYPGGKQVTYSYDLADNLIAVEDSTLGVTTYTYDEEGRQLTCIRPGGSITTYTYDAAGRVLTLTNEQSGAVVSSFAYTYDKEGKIATEELYQAPSADTPALSLARSFTYDEVGELSSYTEQEGRVLREVTYSYDMFGNRVAVSTSGDSSSSLVSEYDSEGRLVKSTDTTSGEVTTYSYDESGNLSSARQTGTAEGTTETTYTYDAENRLKAVREGGALLMAANYDGDSNRIFQIHRTLVPSTDRADRIATSPGEGIYKELASLDALPEILSLIHPFEEGAPSSHYYQERVYPNDFYEWAFYYGAGMQLSSLACTLDTAYLPVAQKLFMDAFNEFLGLFDLEYRYDSSGSYADDDLKALEDAGLSEADIKDITHPRAVPQSPEGSDQPESDDATTREQRPANTFDVSSVVIPENPGVGMRYDYELTYYLNDLSFENTQVASTYGKRLEEKESYTYGRERITSLGSSGEAETFLYDGRGSVVQILEGGRIASSYRYGPFGEVVTGVNPNELTFAHNAEEYNPVTELTYLRARYYAPARANFLTKDTVLGHVSSLNSQNRYSYAEQDPINNADPTGHAIGNTSYERQMESLGGINEIYNFYVGSALGDSYALASRSFYSQLNYAYGVDYTNLYAINSIAGISEETANAYINYGASLALAQSRTWNCDPGLLAAVAINNYASDVNAAKESVNTQIAAVKANKYAQYEEYQAYLAYLAYLEQQYLYEMALYAMALAAASRPGKSRGPGKATSAIAKPVKPSNPRFTPTLALYDGSHGRLSNDAFGKNGAATPSVVSGKTALANVIKKISNPSPKTEEEREPSSPVGKRNGVPRIRDVTNPTSSSRALAEFISNYEGGFSSTPYDATGNGDWTIGYGHSIKPGESFTSITREEAYQIYLSDMNIWETEVRNYSYSQHRIWDQHQYDAFVSLAYNSGYYYRDVMDSILAGVDPYIAFGRIVNDSSGNFQQGLYNRRMDEADMFLRGTYERTYRAP